MAGVVDLRGRNQQQALQRMMYIQEFQAKSGISGNEPSNVERVMSEQAELDLKNKQYERQWAEGQQRMAIAEAEHNRKLKDFDEVQAFRQKQEDFDRWKGTEDSKVAWGNYAINQKDYESKLPLTAAQIEHQKAETGLTRVKTEGEQLKNVRDVNEGMTTDANTRRGLLIAKAARDGYLSPSDTDDFELTERIIGKNPHMQVDRNPDGTIKNPERLPLSVLNKDGVPDASFAKGIRDAEEPYNDFSKLLVDHRNAKAGGATPEMLQHWEDKIWQQTAPYAGQVEGYIAQQMIKEHNIDGAMDYLNAARKSSAPVVKLPDPRERIDYKGTVKMVARLDKLQNSYWKLRKDGKIPVGAIKQPIWNFLAYIGKDDPELQAFRLEAEQFRAKYTLFLSGRATTDAERWDIQKQIPGIFSSFQTFEKALPDFMNGLKEDAAIDMGIAQEYGQKIPQGVPIIRPADILAKGGKLPNVLLEHGAYLAGSAIENHAKGTKVVARRMAAQGVGGLAGNVRSDRSAYANYGKEGGIQVPSEAEGGPPPEAQVPQGAPPPQASQYTDPTQAAGVEEAIRETLRANPDLLKDHPELAPYAPQ